MMTRQQFPLAYRRALVSLWVVLAALNLSACKRAEPSAAATARGAADATRPGSSRVRVFLEDCEFAGWSMIAGGTFLHLVARASNSNPRVLAVHVPSDGRIDFTTSGHGDRAYGEWPQSAWLQTLTDATTGTYEFARWDGTTWTRDPAMAPSVMGMLPWRNGTLLRVERHDPNGTRLSVQNDLRLSAELRVPTEMARFNASEMFTLSKSGIALMTGAVDEQAGYTILAGSIAAVLHNSVGSSTGTASSSCERIIFSQWTDATAENPAPRARAVRIREGRVEPGEDLPAEPAHFAIDRLCHEWLVSTDGALFEKASLSAGWQRVALGHEGKREESTALAALGDRVWVAIGATLYVVHAGKAEKVDVPLSAGQNGASFLLGSDEQADRLWLNVIPVNEKRGTMLTTGPVHQKMRCDELAERFPSK